MAVLAVWKEAGATPLQALNLLRQTKPELSMVKMTYAGRLDPLASGVMLVLTEADVFKKDDFLKLDKEYKVAVLLGVATDTGDVLGLVTKASVEDISVEEVVKQLPLFVKKFTQEYPLFSAPKIDGHQVFSKLVEISQIDFLGHKLIGKDNLFTEIKQNIFAVTGDFRQEQIWSKWEETYPGLRTDFSILSLRVKCSSGTYMRVLAEKIGQIGHLPALAWQIERSKVGEFRREDCVNLNVTEQVNL